MLTKLGFGAAYLGGALLVTDALLSWRANEEAAVGPVTIGLYLVIVTIAAVLARRRDARAR